MRFFLKSAFSIMLCVGFLFVGADVQAGRPKYLFKMASLAPDGSIWAKRFHDFTEEVKEKSNGEVGFKIYPGGIMGDDRAMYRKMKVGQLQAGGFTMTGISEIVPDFRVMGIPFLFNSYDEVDKVTTGLFPRFKKAFADKDLVLLAMTEVGFLYTMSKKPVTTVADLKNSKTWVPEGDPISKVFLETVGVSPTPLSIPDVLTSLQTGLVNTVFNSFYGAIVLQWFTATPYITDTPFAYAYGALVFDRRPFARLPAAYVALFESAAKKNFGGLLEDTRRSNVEALKVLRQNGNVLVKATDASMAELAAYRRTAVKKLVGTAFSRDIYEETLRRLAAVRTAAAVKGQQKNTQVRP